VVQESDGGYCAECLTESVFSEGDTWEELRKNVLGATSASTVPDLSECAFTWYANSSRRFAFG